jgi:hypothetical protein
MRNKQYKKFNKKYDQKKLTFFKLFCEPTLLYSCTQVRMTLMLLTMA